MSEGRIFRDVDGRWEPIGDPLPAWEHAPPRPHREINVWILPKGEGYQPGDVIAFGETGHRLLSPMPPDDAAWDEVIESALATNAPAEVRAWIASVDLWLGMRLQPGWG